MQVSRRSQRGAIGPSKPGRKVRNGAKDLSMETEQNLPGVCFQFGPSGVLEAVIGQAPPLRYGCLDLPGSPNHVAVGGYPLKTFLLGSPNHIAVGG